MIDQEISNITHYISTESNIDYNYVCVSLNDITKKIYNMVRNDSSIFIDIKHLLEELINTVLDNDFYDKNIYNRILSIIVLKNDVILQGNLNSINVDLYFDELNKYIKHKSYLLYDETCLKVCQCYAKIQFAYNLIDGKNLKQEYNNFLIEINNNNVFTNIIRNNSKYDMHEVACVYMYYYLFEKYVEVNLYQHIMVDIMYQWKKFKIIHYKMDKEDLINEGINNYNLVY